MLLAPFVCFALQASREVPLESLNLRLMRQDWGQPRARRSVDDRPLRIGGTTFERGVGTHAVSRFAVRLNGAARFRAQVGVDDEAPRGTVEFQVWLDGRRIWTSGLLRGGMPSRLVDVDVAKAKEMVLVVEDGGDGIDYDHADWAEAALTTTAAIAPVAIEPPAPKVEPPIPIATGNPPGVMIHGPRIVGTTPGRPFLFRIPATGVPRGEGRRGRDTFRIVAGRLPAGLVLDAGTGIIRGATRSAGTTRFTIEARDLRRGADRREYTVVAGRHKLALTPPMGWNSWNVWGTAVDAAKVRAAADSFVRSGLADYGYEYVNIDDAWEGQRDSRGEITTNAKFGDMKSLADYVHSLGLKLGIYSGPGPKTCAGFEGSYRHELQDARTWASWGIDYLKYDWCAYEQIAKNHSLPELQRPYIVMREALDQIDRDIVYSLCQYGMGDVYKWGRSVTGGNLWRTTGDITDTWRSMSTIGFDHHQRSPYAGPGAWNDPDMLVVGRLGWGPNPRPTRLTPNEQITHITLWALLAAPLITGCDLTKLDDFTKAILCNHDVIEVDQDPLGKAATRRHKAGDFEVWARPLWDGSMAVGLFNRGGEAGAFSFELGRLGLRGPRKVRDLWLMKDLAGNATRLQPRIPAHGAMLYRVR